MDLSSLKSHLADIPALTGAKRSEATPSELLCSEDDFCAFKTESGKFGAAWKAHAAVFDAEEDLLAHLNKHEQQLLQFGVGK